VITVYGTVADKWRYILGFIKADFPDHLSYLRTYTKTTKGSPMDRLPPPQYPTFSPPHAMTLISMVVTITM
jgi:hypothetical protein